MGKNTKGAEKKSAAAAAAKVAADNKENNANNVHSNTSIKVIQLGDLDKLAQQRALAGMDPNHAEDLIARLDDRFYKDPDAAKKHNITPETVDAINEITGRAMVALLANEVELAHTPFAVRMRMSSLEEIRKCGNELMKKTEEIMHYAKQLEAQNGYQSQYLKNLETEFASKVQAQNKIIGGLTKQMDSMAQKASEGEVKSNNAKGIGGTHVAAE